MTDYPVLDRTVRELIQEVAAEKGASIYKLTPEEARNTLLLAQSGPVEKPGAQIKDWKVGSTAGPVHLRTIRPVGPGCVLLPSSISMVVAGSWAAQ